MQDAVAPAEPPKRPPKKLYLWTLAIVTYALVIALTASAVWAYLYLDAKIRRERGVAPRDSQQELVPKRRF